MEDGIDQMRMREPGRLRAAISSSRLVDQAVELVGLAEEVGLVDRHGVDQMLHLVRRPRSAARRNRSGSLGAGRRDALDQAACRRSSACCRRIDMPVRRYTNSQKRRTSSGVTVIKAAAGLSCDAIALAFRT